MTEAKNKCSIVVVEDNPADVTLVQEALRAHNVDCLLHILQDGEQAMGFIARLDADPARPSLDLMILDMYLPKYSGEEILARLRATENYGQLPVVVMTGLDSRAIEAKTLKNKAHAAVTYFPKPSTLDEFLELGAIVRTVLNKPRAQCRAGCN